jgi:hypothetical protein
MNSQFKFVKRTFLVVIAALLAWSFSVVVAQETPQAESQETTTTEETPQLPADQLDSLVAPIALYSDSLLAQTLAASTYPLEIIQLQQWMDKNKNLKDKALADAVSKQPWDPSVQGLVPFPDVVQRMASNVQWTTDLGNAFLAQQSDVMDAVQRMRAKAQGTGNLKTSDQQTVATKAVEGGKQVIEIQPAKPDVVYVPSYDPTVVYGAAPTDSPYYNYTYPGYTPGRALAWGTGVAMSAAAWGAWGGHWGDCDWNHGNVNINNNYNLNKSYNKNVNRSQARQGNQWQHNPQHRGGTPYGNRNTANKYGGGGNRAGGGGAGTASRPAGGAGVGKAGGGVAGAKAGGGGPGAKPGGAGEGAKPGGGGAGAKSGKGGGGGDRVGNRTVSSPSKGGSAFGGGSSGNAARASSSRGAGSMGGGKGGGGAKAGGGRGGGGAKGGGGRGGGGGGRK